MGQAYHLEGFPGDQSQVWGQACVPCSLETHRRLGLHGVTWETHVGGLVRGHDATALEPTCLQDPGPSSTCTRPFGNARVFALCLKMCVKSPQEVLEKHHRINWVSAEENN